VQQLEDEKKLQAQLLEDLNKSQKSISTMLKEKSDLERTVNKQKKVMMTAEVAGAKKASDGSHRSDIYLQP
jgi:hypothetical protein